LGEQHDEGAAAKAEGWGFESLLPHTRILEECN